MSVDDLIMSVQNNAQVSTPVKAPTPVAATPEVVKTTAESDGTPRASGTEVREKKSKKGSVRMVYSDQQTSPEEKMAGMKRYAYIPKRSVQKVLGPIEPAFTGPANGPDDVADNVQG